MKTPDGNTNREKARIYFENSGKDDREIAEILGVHPCTVALYRRDHIEDKLIAAAERRGRRKAVRQDDPDSTLRTSSGVRFGTKKKRDTEPAGIWA